ncbi:MAG: efflux RND transporter periplasmic adaptor subunit, partial [Verrucomicrobiae bacterium]|nr:efflux RND transporter periplasmic adaptor subunit [Verrucomicrobiae bacterium]
MSKHRDIARAAASAWLWFRRQPRLRQAGLVLLLIALVGILTRYSRPAAEPGATFAVRRGPLEINVLEGGSIQALESQEIKCEVRVGYQGTKILKIVEEGYLVTEDDVKNGKVLVELDSSDLEKQLLQQEIQYQSALANFTEAQQNYQIQLNQNYSDIKAAEQKVRFARMDFDKLLGADVAETILAELGIEKLLAEAATNLVATVQRGSALLTAPVNGNGPAANSADTDNETRPAPTPTDPPATRPRANTNVPAATLTAAAAGSRPSSRPAPPGSALPPRPPGGNNNPGESPAPAAVPAPEEAALEVELAAEPTLQLPPPSAVDFSRFARLDALGDGEAKQKLRKFDDDLQVAQKELEQSTATLEGTRRLFAKGFVTRTDLQRDEIAHENSRLKVQTAQTARALYLKYDFARSAEETLSKYLDAVRELDKTRRLAISKLAQAEARLRSAQGQYQVQLRQRNDLRQQLAKCVIRAERPGLVVYGGGRDDSFFRGEEPIREGASVRERQTIITIPDMTRMAVSVRIHEAYINKVRKGQKARITVDAFPDKVLTGEVTKVALLPDSVNRWMNPDLKVYATTVAIDGSHEWLKPGMSAKVEILANRLDDVLYVPVQAVLPAERGHICYVLKGRKPEPRPVEIGESNDEFIEIKNGLKEGELVLLRPPPAGARPGESRPESQPPESRPNGNAAPRAALENDAVTPQGRLPVCAAVSAWRSRGMFALGGCFRRDAENSTRDACAPRAPFAVRCSLFGARCFPAAPTALPLPAGERWGEGEVVIPDRGLRPSRRSNLTLTLCLKG